MRVGWQAGEVVDEGQAREVLQGVAKTALGAARMRAEESHRADRLFDDFYAQAFLDAAPRRLPPWPEMAVGTWPTWAPTWGAMW